MFFVNYFGSFCNNTHQIKRDCLLVNRYRVTKVYSVRPGIKKKLFVCCYERKSLRVFVFRFTQHLPLTTLLRLELVFNVMASFCSLYGYNEYICIYLQNEIKM